MVVNNKIWTFGECLPTRLKQGATFRYYLIM